MTKRYLTAQVVSLLIRAEYTDNSWISHADEKTHTKVTGNLFKKQYADKYLHYKFS